MQTEKLKLALKEKTKKLKMELSTKKIRESEKSRKRRTKFQIFGWLKYMDGTPSDSFILELLQCRRIPLYSFNTPLTEGSRFNG